MKKKVSLTNYREVQIKTMKYHTTSSGIITTKKSEITTVSEGAEKLEHLYTVGGNVK